MICYASAQESEHDTCPVSRLWSADHSRQALLRACGAPLPQLCPLGAPNAPGKRFCADCGAALATHDRPAAATSSPAGQPAPVPQLILEEQFTAFQRALPASLQGQLFTQPEGENRVLTILFADLTGSVARTAGLHPEDAAALVDRCSRRWSMPS